MSRTVAINHDEPEGWVWDRAKHSPFWVRVKPEEADYCLNVLPPIYFAGGFAVSEPIRDDDFGRPVYLAVVNAGGKVWARELARIDMAAEAAALRDALFISATDPVALPQTL
jgi:hypothetical protein